MESTENVYYGENTEIVEEENNWGMENVVIVDNDSINWQEESTVNYGDATENPEQTLTENEIYMSANAENSLETTIDQDKSEYYSILDTTYQGEEENYDENVENVKIVVHVDDNEQILNDESKNEGNESLESQVFLYQTEDSDEMYAVQIADDGNGNLQRYKYKVRQTIDGQLEAIPGTIEVQVDDIIEKDLSERTATNEKSDENQEKITSNEEVQEIKKETNEESYESDEEDYGTPEYLLSENEEEEENKNENLDQYLEVTPEIHEDKIEEPKNKFFKSKDKINKKTYLLIDSIEKENVETNPIVKNSRSLLKSTVLNALEDKEIQDAITNIMNNDKRKSSIRIISKGVKENLYSENENLGLNLNEKPNNKIADKSVRQPRKQKIKPIERSGSEIIVQPMFYSFDNTENLVTIPNNKRKLSQGQIEIVKVSDDSEDETTDVPKSKKSKNSVKKRPTIEHITISDSDNTDTESVIEITELEKPKEPEKEKEGDDITKIQEAVNDIVQEREKRQTKITKTNQNDSNKNKLLVKKTFQNNEKRRSLRSEKSNTNFYCSKCKLKFLTEPQLKRHQTIHKEPLIKKSPKLIQKNGNLKLRKSIVKNDTKNVLSSPRRPFKCDQCPMSFSQRTLLASHKSKHKQHVCSKCNIKFMSKQLLDDHIQKKCNKPTLKRKSIISSPIKKAFNFVSCSQCKLRFRSLDILKEHELKTHKKGKVLINSNVKLTRSKRPHGGVPTSDRMQKAFTMMKSKS